MKKIITVLITIMLLSALVVGCGKDESQETDAEVQEATQSSETTEDTSSEKPVVSTEQEQQASETNTQNIETKDAIVPDDVNIDEDHGGYFRFTFGMVQGPPEMTYELMRDGEGAKIRIIRHIENGKPEITEKNVSMSIFEELNKLLTDKGVLQWKAQEDQEGAKGTQFYRIEYEKGEFSLNLDGVEPFPEGYENAKEAIENWFWEK